MKRITKTIGNIALIVLLTAGLSAMSYAQFSDVSRSYAHYDAIQYVQEQGIVSGYSNGTFKPTQNINRVEFLKVIVEAVYDQNEIERCNLETIVFTDTDKDAWYGPYLCMGKKKGLVKGYSNGSFKPSRDINFAEAAKIIVSAYSYHIDQFDINPWYKPYVLALDNRQAIPLEIKSMSSDVTRGQMAEIIYRLHAGITNKASHDYGSITEQ